MSSSVGLLRGLAPGRARAARVLPGFGLSLGVTLSYLALCRPDSARGAGRADVHAVVVALRRIGHVSPRHRVVPAHDRHVGGRRARQRGLRPARCLGARAVSLSGPPRHRRDRRPAVRAADRGCRHHAHVALFDHGMAGPDSRGLGHSGRVHAAGDRRRADLHRIALRGPHGAAGAAGPGSGDGGGGGQPGSEPSAAVSSRDPAHDPAGADDRCRARICACPW